MGANPAQLADQVELLSRRMTKLKMFSEAHEFTSRACEDVVNTTILKEAARVCMVMKEYDEALDYLKLCGKLEKDQNAETYSDIARCMYKLAELRAHHRDHHGDHSKDDKEAQG